MTVMILTTVVRAAETGTKYTPGADNTEASQKEFTFNKDLIIENEYNIPAVTFTFKIEAGDAVSPTESTLPVYSGIDCNKISFSPDTITTDESAGSLSYKALDKNDATGIEADSITIITDSSDSKHYIARKTMKLNFSEVKFTEPGIYRYKITETGDNSAVKNDTKNPKILDVYVEDDTDKSAKKLKIAAFKLYNESALDANKTDSFQNQYPATGLTFGKEVTGNQGSKDKYFKYTLNITNAVAGTVFSVNLNRADATISANPNDATKCISSAVTQPTTLTADSDGKVSQDFYLQDGDYITVYGFVKGTSYEVSEDKEDYTSTEGISADNSSFEYDSTHDKNDELMDSASGTFKEDANNKLIPVYTGFTNDKSGTIPTGVILSATGLIILGIIVVAGIVFFGIRSKKKYEED
ncbi:MAG TPA: hypothetical protein DEO83_08815 [Lachnospiraceae bacterium]|nr:hypothetical protein [Lachnospiraceae bacterium]